MTTKKLVLYVSDPQRAALVLTLGGKLIDCEARRGNRLSYVFSDEDGSATYAASAYIRNEGVPIATFLENLRKCRELLWQYRLTMADENNPYRRTEAEVTNANNVR